MAAVIEALSASLAAIAAAGASRHVVAAALSAGLRVVAHLSGAAPEPDADIDARLQALRVVLKAQQVAAREGHPQHSARGLVSADEQTMANAARHQFAESFERATPASARRSQRGQRGRRGAASCATFSSSSEHEPGLKEKLAALERRLRQLEELVTPDAVASPLQPTQSFKVLEAVRAWEGKDKGKDKDKDKDKEQQDGGENTDVRELEPLEDSTGTDQEDLIGPSTSMNTTTTTTTGNELKPPRQLVAQISEASTAPSLDMISQPLEGTTHALSIHEIPEAAFTLLPDAPRLDYTKFSTGKPGYAAKMYLTSRVGVISAWPASDDRDEALLLCDTFLQSIDETSVLGIQELFALWERFHTDLVEAPQMIRLALRVAGCGDFLGSTLATRPPATSSPSATTSSGALSRAV